MKKSASGITAASARHFRALAVLGVLAGLSGCVSGDVLGSAGRDEPIAAAALPEPRPAGASPTASGSESIAGLQGETIATSTSAAPLEETPPPSALATASSAATDQAASGTQLAALPQESPVVPSLTNPATDSLAGQPQADRPNKTYLINGLLSAVPFIGYGFRNLHEKMPEAQLFSYMGVVEGPAVIAPKIVREVEEAYRADPTVSVNLIGISLGADLITVIANRLDEKNIPVNYLGIVDGTSLKPIPDNVRKADNLTCSNIDCTRAKARLAPGNTVTVLEEKVYRSSHIPLGNNDGLHARVIAQSAS